MLLFLCLSAASVQAEQLGFSRQYLGGSIQLKYSWVDAAKKRQQIKFFLPIEAAETGNSEFRPFDHKAANAASNNALIKYARTQNGLDIKRSFNGLNVEYKGQAYGNRAAISRHINTLQEQAYNTDVKRQFYTVIDNYLLPDHKVVTNRYIAAMRPVANAIRSATRGMNKRERMNFTLSFLQNIPYDILDNRLTSNGAGFQTPYGLLINNKGDCDTKAVALAAIMKNLYPSSKMVMIYVPNHAFLGIQTQPKPGDKLLRIGSAREAYVLSDATGPAQAPVGVVGRDSEAALSRKDYSFLEL